MLSGRKGFRPRRRRWRTADRLTRLVRFVRLRVGRLGFVAGSVLVAVAAAAALLGRARDGSEPDALAERIRTRGVEPAAFLARAARAHRLLFLGDVLPASAPKRIAAEAVEALARGPGLDAVVLEVDASLQPAIDHYLATDPENATILLANPGTLLEHRGAPREYLEIYRRVWRLNRELGPDRRIRIVAADLPGWPPPRPLTPAAAARLYAERADHIARRVESEVLAGNPRARVLFFLGNLHALEGEGGRIRFGGGEPVQIRWLAARLAEREPTEVFSVLVDAAPAPGAFRTLRSWGVTPAYGLLRQRLGGLTGPVAVPLDENFDFLGSALVTGSAPGLELEILPRGYRLRDVADAYILPGAGRRGRTR